MKKILVIVLVLVMTGCSQIHHKPPKGYDFSEYEKKQATSHKEDYTRE
ncbi:hypothetical protein [Marinicella sp. W31]